MRVRPVRVCMLVRVRASEAGVYVQEHARQCGQGSTVSQLILHICVKKNVLVFIVLRKCESWPVRKVLTSSKI